MDTQLNASAFTHTCLPLPTGGSLRASSPLDTQVGGSHYKTKGIQPVEYIFANNIGFFEGSVIKYVTRWKDKGGLADLEKAAHFIEMLIEFEVNNPRTLPAN